MTYTSAEIRSRTFSIRPRGYKREAVESFLARVAADYQLALDAFSEFLQSEYYSARLNTLRHEVEETAKREIGEAEEEARNVTRDGVEAASRIREQGAHEALAITDSASEAAETLLNEAALLRRAAETEARNVWKRTHREVARTHAEARCESEAVLHSARDRAANLLADAEREAQELLEATQREAKELLEESRSHLAALHHYERKSLVRISEMELLLERITHMTQNAASQAVALQASAVGKTKWFAFLEPREIQLATIATLMQAPVQQTVDAFAALVRDLGSLLNQVVAQKQKEAGDGAPTTALIKSSSVRR
jgi:DivIVA domain-containing protein